MRKLLAIGIIVLFFSVGAFAQTTILMPTVKMQFLDTSGNPLSNGHVHTFLAGTTTPQATFTDSGGGTSNGNPVLLDAGGFADIWLTPTISYKFQVDDSGNVLQYTVDVVRTGLLQDASGAITAGSVIFGGTGGIVAQDNTNFFWDDSNNRLGIGTATPAVDLHVVGTTFRLDGTSALFDSTGDFDFDFRIDCGSAAEQDCLIIFADRGTDTYRIGKNNAGQFLIVDISSGVNIFQHQPSGNVLIRTTVAARTFSVLDSGSNTMFDCVDVGVVGDCTITGTLTVDGASTLTGAATVTGSLTATVANPLEGTLTNQPRWIFKQVDHTDMNAGATADTFTLWTLPANTMIHDVVGNVGTAWVGTGISAAVCSVGTAAGSANDLALDDDFFTTGVRYELHDATASGGKGTLLFDATDKFAPTFFVAGGVVEIQCDLTGGNHTATSAGQAFIYILVSQPLANTTTEAN